MLFRTHYVGTVRPDGRPGFRGMARHEKARTLFERFVEEARDHARFLCVSGHDGKMEARPGAGGALAVEVIGRAGRGRALWGLLPARREIALRGGSVTPEEALRVLDALYALDRTAFAATVAREAGALEA